MALRKACTFGKEETEALDEDGSIQVVLHFFASGDEVARAWA